MKTSAIWIVIPTYWGPSNLGVYDHPTPIDGPSTLPLLLDSLVDQKFSQEFMVLILVSATSENYEKLASTRIRELLTNYNGILNLAIADAKSATLLSKFLFNRNINLRISAMRGYSNVRNMQLLIPATLGAETIIALDDDEVIAPDYLENAVNRINKKQNNITISGLAGPYLDKFGSPFINEPKKLENLLLDKSILMNKTIRDLMSKTDAFLNLPITSMALGGNMVFSKSLFTQVGFDPAITRGEDIDYLINAKIAGIDFYFDKKLTITHLPPRQFEAPAYGMLCKDVIRFIYERKKLKFYGLAPKLFQPYPGKLLDNRFLIDAKKALQDKSTKKTIAKFGTAEEIINSAEFYANKFVSQYEAFSKQWPKAIEVLNDHTIFNALIDVIQV